MTEKKCTKCKKNKSLDEFNFSDKTKGTKQAKCRVCTNKISRNHYEANKEIYKKRALKFNKEVAEENLRHMYEYLLQNPCVDCSCGDPIVLQFDHVRGTKRDSISRMVGHYVSWKTILKEIKKCEVRCANCHLRRHAKENGQYKYLAKMKRISEKKEQGDQLCEDSDTVY